ncbi:MAG: TolC family protein [Candidatus Cloacimonetes bacterium]|nr:TolC family protein [Candidatus Cloacimonadota bacterium]
MKKLIIGIILMTFLFLAAEDLDLETSWQILLQNNPQVKSEKLNISDQEVNLKLALSDMLPSGSMSASYHRNGDELDEDSMGYGMSLSQTLYQGGKLYINYQNSQKSLTQAEQSYQTLLLDLRMLLETKYYSVLEKQESLILA